MYDRCVSYLSVKTSFIELLIAGDSIRRQLEAGLRALAAALMLSYGALKLFPLWDPLRGDPRFEKTVKLNHAVLRKGATLDIKWKYWEIMADNLSKAGWS